MALDGIFNGKIIGNPYQVYDELVNWDIAALPHTRRRDDDGFFFMKRKSYIYTWGFQGVEIKPSTGRPSDKWRFTDSYTEDSRGCEGGECKTYYYLVNGDRTEFRVLERNCDECDYTILDQGSRCMCADDKFSRVVGRSSPSKTLLGGVSSELFNENGFGFINVPETIIFSPNQIFPGDYITINGVEQASLAICGQTRQILSIDRYEGEGPYKWKVQLNGEWTNITAGETFPGALAIASSDIGEVPSYVGEDGITTIVDGVKGDVICDFGDGSCIQSVEHHNGSLTYLNDKGFNFFGGAGFNSNAISANNVNYVGKDKIDSVSFKNFLVFFGNQSISTLVFDQTGTSAFHYDLRRDIGVWNKGAHALFDNGLFFIGSDKRIYGASINSSGNGIFDLQLEDITRNVFSHMELLQEGDEAYMASYGDRLYVFLNGRDSPSSKISNHTKILIYDKTYGLWLVHTVCSEVITGVQGGEFLGENVYRYCGYEGDGIVGDLVPYTARAEAIIYKNDNHGLQDQGGIGMDMFRKHSIINAVVLLGKGRYTENTVMQLDKYNNYKYSRYYPIDIDNQSIVDWNNIYDGEIVEPSQCFIDGLSECDNVKNPYAGSTRNYTQRDDGCGACDEQIIFDEYCINYDDNGYAVSPIHKFELTFDEGTADYWRLSFISGGNDIAYFGGFIVKTKSENTFNVDTDPFTTQCCSGPESCPTSNC